MALCMLFYRREAGIELGGGSFMSHKRYSDDVTSRLLNAATTVLGNSFSLWLYT